MDFIHRLSIAQRLALIAGPAIAVNYDAFESMGDFGRFHSSQDNMYYFSTLAVCAAVYFLFPKKDAVYLPFTFPKDKEDG